jgi:cysteine desulfurase
MIEEFGNANSIDHAFGEAAAALLDKASESVAALVRAEPEGVRFTSGSTEAARLAIADMLGQCQTPLRVAITRVEHKAVLNAVATAGRGGAVQVNWIDVDRQARLMWRSLESAIDSGAHLICVMAANNEVGTIYPIREVAARAHAAGATVLVDATQAAGKVELDVCGWGIDYLILSAHKMYGPKGVGALITRTPRRSDAEAFARHDGTPNVPGIAGLGEACRLRVLEMHEDEERLAVLRNRLEAMLQQHIPGIVINGDREHRLSNNLHVSIPGVPNDAVVARLRRVVAISTGAACTTGTQEPSHVLRAMGLPETLQEGALRIGLGKFNTVEEIDTAGREIIAAVDAVQAAKRREAR